MDLADDCLTLPEKLLLAKVPRIISYIPYPQWEENRSLPVHQQLLRWLRCRKIQRHDVSASVLTVDLRAQSRVQKSRIILYNQKRENCLVLTSEFHVITMERITNEPTGHAKNHFQHKHTHTQMHYAHTYSVIWLLLRAFKLPACHTLHVPVIPMSKFKCEVK